MSTPRNNNPITITNKSGLERLIQFIGLVGSNGDLINASNNALDVILQDPVTDPVNLYLNRDLSNFVLNGIQTVDSYILNVVAGHSVVAGNYVCLQEVDQTNDLLRFFQSKVVTAGATTLEVSRPIDYAFNPASVICSKATRVNMAGEVGTIGSPIIYRIAPQYGAWDIYQLHFVMFSPTGTFDDGTFGPIAKLAHGITVRKVNGYKQNIFNLATNGELLGYAETSPGYSTKPPAGTGAGLTATISIKDGNGVASRLDSTKGGALEIWLPESLAAWPSGGTLEIKAEGHVVE